MKWFFKMMLPALVLVSCSKEGGSPVEVSPVSTKENVEVVAHDVIELGRKLENPYSVTNVGKALAALYPTRGEVSVPVTDYYVRFLPKDTVQFNLLSDLGVEMLDHPMDCEILRDGDYYHDPSVPEGEITWQYAVVPPDFDFPQGIRYEILEECFIPDEEVETRSPGDFDWNAVERMAFEITDNADFLEPETRAKARPSGRITIVDDKLRSKKTVGVAGVKMVANVFVKIATTYTDENGNYEFSRKFSAKPRYRICFKNRVGFSIGLNLILIPASISAIGKGSSTGIDLTIDKNSDATLFRRCVVNNAAYDYFKKCQATGVTMPPKNLRFWILNILRPSSTLMMHHGALLDNKLVSKYIGKYASIVRIFAPTSRSAPRTRTGTTRHCTQPQCMRWHMPVISTRWGRTIGVSMLPTFLPRTFQPVTAMAPAMERTQAIARSARCGHITWKTHCTRNVTGEILALAMNIGSNLRFYPNLKQEESAARTSWTAWDTTRMT